MSYRAVDDLIIQSSDSAAKLIFSDPEYNTDPRLDYFVATVEDTGLRASSRVYAYMSEALAKLFDDMAGVKLKWRSLVDAQPTILNQDGRLLPIPALSHPGAHRPAPQNREP